MKVIPKVGQVWLNRSGSYRATVLSSDLGVVTYMIDNSRCKSKRGVENFHCHFTFVPQTDLEWLAANIVKWEGAGTYSYLKRIGAHSNCYHRSSDVTADSYSRQQWQDKRNELFGVEYIAKLGKKVSDHPCAVGISTGYKVTLEEEPAAKMKVDYKQIEDSIFNLHVDFVNRELYYKNEDGNWYTIKTVVDLAVKLESGKCFRKVETPVTWQDEANALFKRSPDLREDDELIDLINCKYGDAEETKQFIAMCHLVASLTGNPNE